VVLLAGVLAVAGAVTAFLRMEVVRSRWTDDQVYRERAFALAEAGVDHVAALLNASVWTAGDTLDWSSDLSDNDGDGLVDESDETLAATAELWGADGVDNDGDAVVDEPDEDIVRVSCQATVGRSTRPVLAWLTRPRSTLPDPAAAVYLNDENANTSFSGNAFRIDGNDVNLDGTAGSGSPIYGIAINGDPNQVLAQLNSQQEDNVTGIGGYPSVGQETPNDPFFIQGFVSTLEPSADLLFQNYGGTYTGTLGDWTTGNYLITLSKGDFHLGGGSTGAGVLLVDGNLTISGGWEFVGFVFVTGTVRLTGGGGGKRLQGALFVAGDVEQTNSTQTEDEDLTVTGTVDLLFSSQALAFVRDAVSEYRVSALTEP
jgi:hypothetical protein